jgi:SAM-dependent methyltransferase
MKSASRVQALRRARGGCIAMEPPRFLNAAGTCYHDPMVKEVPSEERTNRIRSYYNAQPESNRFGSPSGKLEYERSKAIISRYLGGTPRDILDVGGGTGAYSFWLAGLGHRVTFVDLSDVHVAAVTERNRESEARLVDIREGNALALDFPEKSFDIVLNMGPLYHLPIEERNKALGEMHRVLRIDGLLVSAYISRFAALMDGYKANLIMDPAYVPLALGDVEHGVHDSTKEGTYFTLAYMHRPEEIALELEVAGFRTLDVLAVEGFFWTYSNLGQFTDDPEKFSQLLEHARMLEKEPSIMGTSAHFLAISRKGTEKT